MKNISDILKIKGSSYSFQAIRFVLKTTNLFDIKAALREYIGKDFDMFAYDDVVLDFAQIPDAELAIFQNQNHHNWLEWKSALRLYKLNLIACSGFKDFKNNNSEDNPENNLENNKTDNYDHRPIDDLILELKRNQITYLKTNKIDNSNAKSKAANSNEVIPENSSSNENSNENNNNNNNNNNDAANTNPNAIANVEIPPSRYITNDIRGGTEIMENGSIIIVGNVNSGAQVVSFSDIFVFGELRGKIFAGGSDNISARIITSNFNPELIAIAGVFKTFENGIPEEYLNKSVCVSLEEDEENDISRLKIEVIKL